MEKSIGQLCKNSKGQIILESFILCLLLASLLILIQKQIGEHKEKINQLKRSGIKYEVTNTRKI
jgi:hypothetical protein